MKKTILLSLLLGCTGFVFAETPDYKGLWSAFDGQGNPYYFSIAPDKTAKTLFSSNFSDVEVGVWREDGNRALMTYTSGWLDVLERNPDGDGILKVAYEPGASIAGEPSNKSLATRIGPSYFYGNWRLTDEHGDAFFIKVNADNTASSTYAKSAAGFKGETGVWRWEGDQLMLVYTDGWVDVLIPTPGGVVTVAYAPGYKVGSSVDRSSSVTRADEGEMEFWSISFEDTFGGTSLGTSWSIGYPWTDIINNEVGAYVPENVQLKEGKLFLLADKKEGEYGGKKLPYTASAINTRGIFAQAYGYFEIRCKVPQGAGLWPSFWLLPADASNAPQEIIVFDIFGDKPSEVNFLSVAKNKEGKTVKLSNGFQGIDFSKAFHNFGIKWTPSEITYFVDGRQVAQVKENIPSASMYLIVNLAVGGFSGLPNNTTPFPAALEVDYVRVFKKGAP